MSYPLNATFSAISSELEGKRRGQLRTVSWPMTLPLSGFGTVGNEPVFRELVKLLSADEALAFMGRPAQHEILGRWRFDAVLSVA